MLGRAKNRRKSKEARRRLRLPALNWRYLAYTLSALALIACATAAISWALNQPIETVAVQGRFQRVTPGDVERVVKSCVHGAGLLSVDLAAVRRAIHTLPWVDAVSVERDWPKGLTVLVVEQTAAARWGERGLLNTRGELFDSDEHHIPPELAQLEGPEGKEALVAQRYLAAEGRLLQAGVRMTALRLDARAPDALESATVSDWTVDCQDVVVGDNDGVLFVPAVRADEICALAETIRDTERRQAERIRAGETLRGQVQFSVYLARRQRSPSLTFRDHLHDVGGAIEV